MQTGKTPNGEFPCSMQDHYEEFRKLAAMTQVMNERIDAMHRDTNNLKYLPMIVDELRDMKNGLIQSATGSRHVPLAATLPVIGAMTFCILILGGLLFSFHSGSQKMRITPTSLEVSGNNHPQNH